MTLDLTSMAGQIEAMGDHLSRSAAKSRQRLGQAQSRYDREAGDLEPLRSKLLTSKGKVTWMPAGLEEGWTARYPLPATPQDFAVIATDGSQIELERHAPASCYLVNIGSVSLLYGSQPDAHLTSQASLFFKEEDLVLTNPANTNETVLVESKHLKLRRSIMEVQALAGAAEAGPRIPTLALLDGTLILWDLSSRDVKPFVRKLFLDMLLEAMDTLQRIPDLAVASYISSPGATEVVNALRIAECPREMPDCDRFCSMIPADQERTCDQVAQGLRDADLFRPRLGPGERSPLFRSNSRVLDDYRAHAVYFFYLNAGEEMARVEVPGWVATDPKRLELTHALVMDQVNRGQGYPVALMEAHEQAVVQAGDREAFWALVEEVMAEGRLYSSTTSKAQSKRTRGV